jgi:hypothetical protein
MALRKNCVIHKRVELFNDLLSQLGERLFDARLEALWENLEVAELPSSLIHAGEVRASAQH